MSGHRSPPPSLVLALLCAGALAPRSAAASEQVRVPEMLRGDLIVGYQGGMDSSQLRERADLKAPWTEVARSTRQHHGLLLKGEFSFYHGVAFLLDVPATLFDRRTWSSARQIRYDPASDRPSSIGARELSREQLDGSRSSRVRNGLGDLSVGFRGVLFAQRGVPGRVAPANMALELKIRMPTGTHKDNVRENGSTQVGIGGVGLKFQATWSRRMNTLEPYLNAGFELNAPYRAELLDADDQIIPSSDENFENRSRLDPGDKFFTRLGTEILLMEDVAQDAVALMDLSLGFTYSGPHELSSGTRIAAPMKATVGYVATTGEYLSADLGLSLRIRPRSAIELWIDFAGSWLSPHSVERLAPGTYDFVTGPDSFSLNWGMGTRLRFR